MKLFRYVKGGVLNRMNALAMKANLMNEDVIGLRDV